MRWVRGGEKVRMEKADERKGNEDEKMAAGRA